MSVSYSETVESENEMMYKRASHACTPSSQNLSMSICPQSTKNGYQNSPIGSHNTPFLSVSEHPLTPPITTCDINSLQLDSNVEFTHNGTYLNLESHDALSDGVGGPGDDLGASLGLVHSLHTQGVKSPFKNPCFSLPNRVSVYSLYCSSILLLLNPPKLYTMKGPRVAPEEAAFRAAPAPIFFSRKHYGGAMDESKLYEVNQLRSRQLHDEHERKRREMLFVDSPKYERLTQGVGFRYPGLIDGSDRFGKDKRSQGDQGVGTVGVGPCEAPETQEGLPGVLADNTPGVGEHPCGEARSLEVRAMIIRTGLNHQTNEPEFKYLIEIGIEAHIHSDTVYSTGMAAQTGATRMAQKLGLNVTWAHEYEMVSL